MSAPALATFVRALRQCARSSSSSGDAPDARDGTSIGGCGRTAAATSTTVASGRAPCRHTQKYAGLHRRFRSTLMRNPAASASYAEDRVGDEMVRRGVRHDRINDVSGARVARREVHEAVVAGPARQPLGGTVLAALAFGEQHFNRLAQV